MARKIKKETAPSQILNREQFLAEVAKAVCSGALTPEGATQVVKNFDATEQRK